MSRRPWPRNDRGFVLWLFGFAVALAGCFNFVVSEPPAYVRRMLVIPFHYGHIPPVAWGIGFITAGVLAMAVAYDRQQDRIGYTVLTALCSCSSLAYLAGVPLGGSVRGLAGTVIYGLFALILYRLAGYDDTLDAEPQVHHGPR